MGPAIQLAVLFGGMGLLMLLVVRGKSIFVVAPLCALLTVTFSGFDPVEALTRHYMTGFADYIRRFYLVFALGAAFGKLLDDSGAATTIADCVGRLLGRQRACLAVVLACAVLTYGGVSLFVVGFSAYPLAVRLFRAANLPRRFIPAAIAFGSITFTMTSAGSTEIQNLMPIQYLVDATTGQSLTDARAGWPVSLIVAMLMFSAGQLYLEWAIRRDIARGQGWEERDQESTVADLDQTRTRNKTSAGESEKTRKATSVSTIDRPAVWAALAPLATTLLALNALPAVCHSLARAIEPVASGGGVAEQVRKILAAVPEDPTLAIFLGVLIALATLRQGRAVAWSGVGEGFFNGLFAIGSTASVVGFGAAVQKLPAFQQVVDWVTRIPGDPLLSAALAVAVIAAIAGSASGGQGIALPILKPIYIDELGVSPRALHRVVAISSGTLDSLPANGYLVMLIRNICGETHGRAYGPIAVVTVLIPLVGTAIAIALFRLFPEWAAA